MSRSLVVVNTGSALYVNGRELKISQLDTRHVYVQGKQCPSPIGKLATKEDTLSIFKLCQQFNWAKKDMGLYLAGWIVVAPLAGALPIRPHVWISGPSGSGKSTVMKDLVKQLLPAFHAYQGDTTSAGIRQTQSSSSLPVVFDEFETSDSEANKIRIANIIELVRQCWSETDGAVVKGSTGGTATPYQVAFSILVGSIRVSLAQAADESRFSVLELKKHNSNIAEWKALEAKLKAITPELGIMLWRRSISMIDTILINYERFRDALVSRGETMRWATQHGMLLAGAYSLESDGVVTQDLLDDFISLGTEDDSENSDEMALYRKLYTSKIRYMNHERTLETWLGLALTPDHDLQQTALYAMRDNGIAIHNARIFISNGHESIAKILKGSPWHTQWSRVLKRLPGAKCENEEKSFGKQSRSTSFPLTPFATGKFVESE